MAPDFSLHIPSLHPKFTAECLHDSDAKHMKKPALGTSNVFSFSFSFLFSIKKIYIFREYNTLITQGRTEWSLGAICEYYTPGTVNICQGIHLLLRKTLQI